MFFDVIKNYVRLDFDTWDNMHILMHKNDTKIIHRSNPKSKNKSCTKSVTFIIIYKKGLKRSSTEFF